MKNFIFVILFQMPSFLWGQSLDSTAIRQVDSLIEVSKILTGQQEFERALDVNAAAEKLALDIFGLESEAYGSCCFNRGRVLHYKGDFLAAEQWYLASRNIREKVLGSADPDYANSLNNLALLYVHMGQYEQAEPLYHDAKIIRESVFGKEHPAYAGSLINQAILSRRLGQYEKAERLYLEAKDVWAITFGKDHPEYAKTLHYLGNLYRDMGQYEKAEPLYLEAKAIMGKALGKHHPDYANSLDDLAVLYNDRGQYEKSEPLYLEAKTIWKNALGKEHPDYAKTLHNLGNLYRDMGRFETAEPLFLEAKDIIEKALGKEHPTYAKNLNYLGNLYQDMGRYQKAEPLYLEAKAIRGKALGKEHLNYANSLINLAMLYKAMGQYGKSEPLFLELYPLNQILISKALQHLSERELSSYLNKFSGDQDQTLSFTQVAASSMLESACYDNALFYKGFLLNTANQVKRLALSDSIASQKFKLLKSYQRRLAAQYAQPIAGRDSSKIAQLEIQANDLEKDLARTVAGYGEALRQVKWQEVRQSLQPGEAALEFVHYRFYNLQQTDSLMYAALLLLPGRTPQFITLFEERSLDSLLLTQGERRSDYVNNLYTLAERGVNPIGKPQKSLYELIWHPLEKELAGVHTVYFSPAGLLHRLNLGAIPLQEEETIADHYRLFEVNSTRQLVVNAHLATVEATATLFGGIQYEMDSTAIAAANTGFSDEPLQASRSALNFSGTDTTLRGDTWNYLKWTEKEVVALEAILKSAGIETSTFKAYAATEETLKSISRNKLSPRILHIATHGFFFPDPKSGARQDSAFAGKEPVFKISDHPMIRSGLLLAGSNYAWQTGKPLQPTQDDGILTAFEISQMNLSNTELVVLSACETGLGDIQGNEGVYGLQRAFKIAGSKYLVMSLWQVPDQETSIFMIAFYAHWLNDKMSIPDAFRSTQKEMRERFINPYQWAGFVLVE